MLVILVVPDEAEKLVNIERSAVTLFCQIRELAWAADAQGKSVNQHLEFIVDGDCFVGWPLRISSLWVLLRLK